MDDGWSDPERDERGRLQADRTRFPSGGRRCGLGRSIGLWRWASCMEWLPHHISCACCVPRDCATIRPNRTCLPASRHRGGC